MPRRRLEGTACSGTILFSQENNPLLPLDQYPSLVLFAQVVQHRSFSAAAREAGIAKSAVSRRIAELERSLKIRLLQRTTRSLHPTDEGLRIYEQCSALLAAGAAVQDLAGQSVGEVRGLLRVNAPVFFAQTRLGPVIAEYLVRHPQAEVELSTDDRILDVVAGGYDVMLRIGRMKDSSLVARKLASERLVVAGSPEYLARHGEPTEPEQLVDHQCLHYSLISRSDEWRFRRGGRVIPLHLRGRLSSANGRVLVAAAVAGVGLVVIPYFGVEEEVRDGRLKLVLEHARKAEIGIYAMTAHRTHAPARVTAFLQLLAARFRERA
jgi:DNA-binding transcriptional LysR family regulator